MTEVSEDTRKLALATFSRFDVNGDNCIDSTELGDILRSAGLSPTERSVAEAMTKYDTDGNGTIERDEFVALFNDVLAAAMPPMDELRQSFHAFDVDGNGLISLDELKHALTTMGEPMEMSEVEAILSSFDEDGNGELDMEEFVAMMCATAVMPGAPAGGAGAGAGGVAPPAAPGAGAGAAPAAAGTAAAETAPAQTSMRAPETPPSLATGSCLCGEVQFEATVPVSAYLHCFCGDCTRIATSPVVTMCQVPSDGFTITAGAPKLSVYESSSHGRRKFCSACGTHVSFETMLGQDLINFFARLIHSQKLARMLAEEKLGPYMGHMFFDQARPWLRVEDDGKPHLSSDMIFGMIPELRAPAPEPLPVEEGHLSGRCHCGHVKFRVASPAQAWVMCHCNDCGRHNGTSVTAHGQFPEANHTIFEGQDAVRSFESSDHGTRSFCAHCGTTVLFTSSTLPGLMNVPLVLLEDPNQIIGTEAFGPLMGHVFVDQNPAWGVRLDHTDARTFTKADVEALMS